MKGWAAVWGRGAGRAGALAVALCWAAAFPSMPALAVQRAPESEAAALGDGGARLAVSYERGFPAAELGALVGVVFSSTRILGAEASARLGAELLHFRAGSPFVRHGDAVFQLANAPYLARGHFWVPLELLSERHPIARARTAAGSGVAAPMASVHPGSADAPAGTASVRSRRGGPWRVVIDAGHGGHDPGTVSRRTGAREKDITLAVALRLHDLLKRRSDLEPILTRADDRFLKLRERSRIATAKSADLFVSIHVNAQERGSSARGFETYFLSEARTEESKRVAMRENSVLELEGETAAGTIGTLQYILAGLEQNENVQESNRFAGFVQNELRREVESPDRGVKQAGFYVLMGATGTMPSVLVETGFITNPGDEKMLRSRTGVERIARSLDRAIGSYFEEVDRRLQRLSAAGAGD